MPGAIAQLLAQGSAPEHLQQPRFQLLGLTATNSRFLAHEVVRLVIEVLVVRTEAERLSETRRLEKVVPPVTNEAAAHYHQVRNRKRNLGGQGSNSNSRGVTQNTLSNQRC